MWLLYLMAFLLLLFMFAYYHYTSTLSYWEQRDVAFLKPLPFFGNIKDQILFRKSAPEVLQDLYNQFEGHGFAGIYQSRTPALLIRDPELIKTLFIKDFQHFPDRGINIDEKKDPLAGNLFNIEGARWRNLRVKLTPVFTSGKMKMMFGLVCKCAEDLVQCLQQTVDVDVEIKEAMANYTTEVIGTCAFGLQINSLRDPDSVFRKMGKLLFLPPGAILRKPLRFLLPQVTFRLYRENVTKFFCNLVSDTISYRERNGVVRNDFMQLLIQLRNKGRIEEDGLETEEQTDNTELTMEQIAAQAMVFFLAGFETSSTTMSFCLHELAMNTDVQSRLRDDIDAVLEKHGGQITYEAIQQMEYLDHVVAETLRKYPPISTLTRVCRQRYVIPDTTVEVQEGTPIVFPVYAIHHDPLHYPDPDRFYPDRFADEQNSQRHPFAYLPFGEGPRVCIGMRFGLMQTKVGLSALLSKYEFSPCERTSHPLKFNPKTFITSTSDGIWLQIKNRDASL